MVSSGIMPSLVFSYQIVPKDNPTKVLVNGALWVSSVDAAKRYVQSARSSIVAGRSDLEVILRDSRGSEIWRGPYLGSDDA